MISLYYIAEAPHERSVAFLDYSTIEAYEAADALIEWESKTADPTPAAAVGAIRDQLRSDYDALRSRYQYVDRNGKVRRYPNWANRSIADMANVDPKTARLYGLIYRQLSAYVHGSSWSFRHLPADTPANYDVNVVLADMAQVTLGTVVVWQAFGEFGEGQLGWNMAPGVDTAAVTASKLSKVAKVGLRAHGT